MEMTMAQMEAAIEAVLLQWVTPLRLQNLPLQ